MTQRLDDGHQTLITFAADPTVRFWEKSVTPPGMDGGGEIDTTTMRNTAWRTKASKALVTLTESSATVAYDPVCYNSVLALMNINNLITITFSDGSTLQFYGWLDKFTPGECTEGEQPTAEISILPSNQNASGEETAPVYAE